ncbi:helix-turn-helix domain-containing protein [Deinococcus yavapaiensis]|uniref:Helix-turn-helix protein n=1 Tax=Deinococcus yavapaiensis KR-236 TaxID=694435 RepID=A0A318S6E1_9DEIO|nr:helix-turn-helix transcriptional regulator [Deinococcus yavapaiensis]PYE51984.1 helix-turn-helix protein [Deinococcus yavapaiensis KR-236]
MPSRGDTPSPSADDHAVMQHVGARILALRHALSLNQDEFAHRAGMHRSYVTQVENGRKDLRITTLQRVAVAFGLQLHELLDPSFVFDADELHAKRDDA